jgi:hypothetical protein
MGQLKSRDDVIELTDEEFRTFLLELRDCNEAVIIFPDMYLCPCCAAVVNQNGILEHKPKQFYTN